MEKFWLEVSLWFVIILISSLISLRLGLTAALVELIVGILVGNTISLEITSWVKFLASFGAVVLTFLAGAELESEVVRSFWKEAIILGVISFLAPFLGVWFLAQFLLGWEIKEAQIAGLALSTTSVAVVYAVMIETGLNEKPFGKLILAATFITDLGTVIFLGLLFTELGLAFWLFVILTLVVLFILPSFTKRYFSYVKNHPSEPEVKFIFLVLALLGYLAAKAGSEAVLPAYLTGAVLANLFIHNRELVKRMRATTIALLTPFFFIKAGCLVDLRVVWQSFGLLALFFLAKCLCKFIGLFPAGMLFKFSFKANMYNTLLMCTGLTFGTISALYGFNMGIITKDQYSILVVAVISTAIIPTLIAQKFFSPKEEELPVFQNPKREI
ncbi:MAG: cation:proton antiporter [Thermodesulfobacteriaceae bacterium]|nr:cation:proton antiporter [Thermodesulfobacteriaceae bacterium]